MEEITESKYYSGFMTREPCNQKEKLMMRFIHGGKYVFSDLGDVNKEMEDAVETIIKYNEELNIHPDLVKMVFKKYLKIFKKRRSDEHWYVFSGSNSFFNLSKFGGDTSSFLDDNKKFTDNTYGNFLAACGFGNLETLERIFEVTEGVEEFWEENSWNEGMHAACGCNSTYGFGLIDSNMWISSNLSQWVKDYSSVCTNGNMKVIELMISKGAHDFNKGLAIASAAGNLNAVELMINNGANDFNRGLRLSNTIEITNFLISKKLASTDKDIKIYRPEPRMFKNPPKPYELLFLSDKSKYYSEFCDRDCYTFNALDREIMELLRNGLMNISARGITTKTREALEVIVKYHKELEVHPNVVQRYKDDLKRVTNIVSNVNKPK